jgi:hypothetical protein
MLDQRQWLDRATSPLATGLRNTYRATVRKWPFP